MWKPEKDGHFLTIFACEIVFRLLYSLKEIYESIMMVGENSYRDCHQENRKNRNIIKAIHDTQGKGKGHSLIIRV